MTDLLNDFIKETFGGKRSTLDQLNDEIKTIDNLTKTIERINGKLTERFDMESKALRRWIDKCAALKEKVKLYEQALMVACEEVEHLQRGYIHPCAYYDDMPQDSSVCNLDCGECLKAYFLKRGQENIDMEKSCKGEIDKANAVNDEIAGRKRMDEQDMKKEKMRR